MKLISGSRWSELREGRWTLADASEVLDALAESGKSARRFAAEHDLSVQRLYWWRRRLAEHAVAPSSTVAAALVPLHLTGGELRGDETALLHLAGGVVLEVPLSASPDWVAAVARSLSEG